MIFENDEFVDELNANLKKGAVVSFVTDTVWGVGCLPKSADGVDKIYELKGRDRSKPLILMSDRIENLLPYVKNVPDSAKKLMDKYFPGALTLIFEKSESTPDYVTSGKNTVGIRVPKNEVFRKMCEKIDGHVLATTSANLSNQPSAKNYADAKKFIGERVDYVFEDYGYICEGLESTVALVTGDSVKILRQGAVNL